MISNINAWKQLSAEWEIEPPPWSQHFKLLLWSVYLITKKNVFLLTACELADLFRPGMRWSAKHSTPGFGFTHCQSYFLAASKKRLYQTLHQLRKQINTHNKYMHVIAFNIPHHERNVFKSEFGKNVVWFYTSEYSSPLLHRSTYLYLFMWRNTSSTFSTVISNVKQCYLHLLFIIF